MVDDYIVKSARLAAYIRVENKDELYTNSQSSKIEKYASKELFDIVEIESEVARGSHIQRQGLWRVLRRVVCANCEPKQMPISDDFNYWFREATKPCVCNKPLPLQGIIINDLAILCTEPAPGSRFLLEMCALKKHVFVVDAKTCLSCCNEQAKELIKKRML